MMCQDPQSRELHQESKVGWRQQGEIHVVRASIILDQDASRALTDHLNQFVRLILLPHKRPVVGFKPSIARFFSNGLVHLTTILQDLGIRSPLVLIEDYKGLVED